MTNDEDLSNDVFDLAYKVIKKNRELSKQIKALEETIRIMGAEKMSFDLSKTTSPGLTPPYTINPIADASITRATNGNL